jgi:uncharacterized protein YbbK (DUF523 family)
MIIVSACLAGIKCRYDGKCKSNPKIQKLVNEGLAIPICPEMLAGLPTPREPCEILKQKVISKKGIIMTEEFKKGAEIAFNIAKINGCNFAILKSKSPSCGFKKIYDGTFTGKLKKGNGLFTQKLINYNVKIKDENDFKK